MENARIVAQALGHRNFRASLGGQLKRSVMKTKNRMVAMAVWLACLSFGLHAAAFAQVAAKTAATPGDDLLMQLPASDIVAVVDVKRVMGELLPRLKKISVGGIGKTASEIELFAKLSGIDPAQVKAAVLGVKMTETLGRGSGLLLLQGVTVDTKKLAEAAKAAGHELKTSEHQGKTLYTLSLKEKADATANDIHFAILDPQRLAIGDLSAVQSILTATTATAAHAGLAQALKETKNTGLIRFAGNLPEALRVMLASQGELFAQVAAVKAIFGALDLNGDNTATLEARARTASNNDATQLKESLRGLIELGRVFLSGDDAKSKLYLTLLDKVQINTQAQDVALTLVLPKELLE
jgi:hypothetical protein